MTRIRRLSILGGILLLACAILGYRWWTSRAIKERLTTARAHLNEGEAELALHRLRPLLQSGRRDGELMLLAARAYRLLGEADKALQCLETAAEAGYETEETELETGLALTALGRLAEAKPLLMGSPTKEAAAGLAAIHLQLQEMEKALDNFSTWKQLAPADASPYFWSGVVWAQAHEHAKAAEQFRRALDLKGDFLAARIELGKTLQELGEVEEAAQLLRQCDQERPDDPEIMVRLASCELELGNAGTARAILEASLKQHAHVVAAYVELGKIELDDGNAERAVELLQWAVALEPTNDPGLYNLSLALGRFGRDEEANGYLSRSQEIQQLRRRLSHLLDVVRADPENLDACCEAGELWLELGQPQRAASLFAAVLARDPTNSRALAAWREQSQQPSDDSGQNAGEENTALPKSR